MTLRELRQLVTSELKEAQIESPEVESGLLISYALDVKRTDLIGKNFEVDEKIADKIFTYTKRRISGEPVQYIIGKAEFMSLEFSVNRSTLIPRADTEVLVEALLKRLPKSKISVLDIGCGSGCIGLSLAYYLKDAIVTEADISKEALDTAKINCKNLGLDSRIKWLNTDILNESIESEFDCIVSNPPYIPSRDIAELSTEVKDFEPKCALDGGDDGLIFYRRITKIAKLKSGGILAFEAGIHQADAVAEIIRLNGFEQIEILPDLSGIDRVIISRKK